MQFILCCLVKLTALQNTISRMRRDYVRYIQVESYTVIIAMERDFFSEPSTKLEGIKGILVPY